MPRSQSRRISLSEIPNIGIVLAEAAMGADDPDSVQMTIIVGTDLSESTVTIYRETYFDSNHNQTISTVYKYIKQLMNRIKSAPSKMASPCSVEASSCYRTRHEEVNQSYGKYMQIEFVGSCSGSIYVTHFHE